MLSRAERATLLDATPKRTNELVGPGSYAVPEAATPSGPSASFAWSGQRCATVAAAAPSAAAAAAPDSPCERMNTRPWTTSNTSSSFASSTQRFALDKESAAKPGPGAYQMHSKWAQQQPSLHAAGGKRKGSSHTPSAALIGCPVRVPDPSGPAAAGAAAGAAGKAHAELLLSTPPSIPARHQSFGYEPGPGGSLVMQPPPAPAAAKAPGKAPATAAAGNSSSGSSRARSPGRPGTVPPRSAKGGFGAGGPAGRSSSACSPVREPTRQLQQQLQAVQRPSAVVQQLAGSTSPRFRCAAGGKLVLSRGSQRAGSAAFTSKSARPHQQEPDPDKLTPGPGAYSSSSSCVSTRPLSAPAFGTAAPGLASSPRGRKQQPLFARTAGRSAALSVGPGWSPPLSKSLAPGPGAYNLRPATVSAATALLCGKATAAAGRAAGGVRAQLGVGPAAAGGDGGSGRDAEAAAAAAAAGFGCTSRRFSSNTTVAPGPGKYTTDQLLSMSAEAARRAAAASKRGAFGTAASARTPSLIDEALFGYSSSSGGGGGGCGGGSMGPGPGCYHVRVGLADSVAAAAARPSPGFASGSERFTPASAPIASPDYASFDGSSMRGDQTQLGPGAYLKLDDWRRGGDGSSWHGGYRSAPFGSESGRHGLAAAAAQDAPGPGSYACVDVGKVFQPLSMPGKAGFATTSQRFKLATATPDTVGPCTYQQQQSSLVKPTFNVTLDQ